MLRIEVVLPPGPSVLQGGIGVVFPEITVTPVARTDLFAHGISGALVAKVDGAVVLGAAEQSVVACAGWQMGEEELGHIVAVAAILPNQGLAFDVPGQVDAAVIGAPHLTRIGGMKYHGMLVGPVVFVLVCEIRSAHVLVPADQRGVQVEYRRRAGEAVGRTKQGDPSQHHEIGIVGLDGHSHGIVTQGDHRWSDRPVRSGKIGKVGTAIFGRAGSQVEFVKTHVFAPVGKDRAGVGQHIGYLRIGRGDGQDAAVVLVWKGTGSNGRPTVAVIVRPVNAAGGMRAVDPQARLHGQQDAFRVHGNVVVQVLRDGPQEQCEILAAVGRAIDAGRIVGDEYGTRRRADDDPMHEVKGVVPGGRIAGNGVRQYFPRFSVVGRAVNTGSVVPRPITPVPAAFTADLSGAVVPDMRVAGTGVLRDRRDGQVNARIALQLPILAAVGRFPDPPGSGARQEGEGVGQVDRQGPGAAADVRRSYAAPIEQRGGTASKSDSTVALPGQPSGIGHFCRADTGRYVSGGGVAVGGE